MRYPHTRPRPRSLRTPSTRAYAFDTHAYALDTLTLDTARTRSTPSRMPSMPPPLIPRVRVQHPRVHLSMPPPSTPARTRSTPTCTRSAPTRTCTTPMRTLAHMHRPDALHPWPLTHVSMQAGAGGIETSEVVQTCVQGECSIWRVRSTQRGTEGVSTGHRSSQVCRCALAALMSLNGLSRLMA